MRSEHEPSLTALYVRTSGESRTLSPKQPIRKGAEFAVAVSLDQTRFIYVGRMSRTAGLTSLLYPHSGSPPSFQAGEPVRVPPDGGWLVLDHIAGDEKLCVILTNRELAEAGLDLRGGDEREPPPPPIKGSEQRVPEVRLLEIRIQRDT